MLKGFRFTTAGESHGEGMYVIVEGVPAGIPLAPDDVSRDLARRQLGHGRGERMSIERDAGQIVAGVRLGETIRIVITRTGASRWRSKHGRKPMMRHCAACCCPGRATRISWDS